MVVCLIDLFLTGKPRFVFLSDIGFCVLCQCTKSCLRRTDMQVSWAAKSFSKFRRKTLVDVQLKSRSSTTRSVLVDRGPLQQLAWCKQNERRRHVTSVGLNLAHFIFCRYVGRSWCLVLQNGATWCACMVRRVNAHAQTVVRSSCLSRRCAGTPRCTRAHFPWSAKSAGKLTRLSTR